MAQTEEQLKDYFKQVSNRNDWSHEDFLSARKETHDYVDQIDFLLKSIYQLSTCRDEVLDRILTRLNQARSAVQNEISRRNT